MSSMRYAAGHALAATLLAVLLGTGLARAQDQSPEAGQDQAPAQSDEVAAEDTAPETVLFTDRPGPSSQISFNMKMLGEGYDSGATNPLLASLDFHQCRVICQLDDRCKAYGYDKSTLWCTLRNTVGELQPAPGVDSGVYVDRPEGLTQSRVVARDGPQPSFDDTILWQAGDTAKAYVARLRKAAEGSGVECAAESAILDDLKAGIGISAPQTGIAGEALAFAWSGNRLQERIPVWIELSTAAPVRFSGKGFFGLAPGALGPFGIDIAKDQTRAFAALFSYSAGTEGNIGVVPLAAGDMDVTARLVGYLRQCQKVVTLSEQKFALTIRPAPPRIVLHDQYGLDIYEKRVDVKPFGRKVLYSKDRFLILDAELGSEILERNGSELVFSPTGRFIAVRNDGATDIIDLVDGTDVARIGDPWSWQENLVWFHNDSFVAIHRGPWGRAWLASTLNTGKPLFAFETSAACCDLSENAQVDVNLENAIVLLRGGLRGAVADLQDLGNASDYPDMDGSDTTFAGSAWMFLNGLGTVSPVLNAVGWNQPQPPKPVKLAVVEGAGAAQIEKPPADKAELGEMRSAVAMANPVEAKRAGVDLTQFGFQTAPEIDAESLLAPDVIAKLDREDPDALEQARSGVRDLVSRALAGRGIEVEWMKATGDFDPDINCDYIRTGDKVGERELPGALDIVQRINRPAGTIWVMRSRCEGGGTSASQVFKSALMIIDESRLAGRPAHEAIVEEFETENSALGRSFHDLDFRTKLVDDRHILFTMPGGGSVGLFDIETRKFTYKQQNLTRGDLLADARLSADGRFVLQINSDNSFALQRVGNSSLALEGRQVDGETIFWTSDFHFDATPEGASFVQLRFPGQYGQYSFQQFDRRLRSSGLLEAVLKDEDKTEAVAIDVPPRLTGKLSAKGARIVGEATPSSASQLAEIRLYQDGVLTDTFPAGNSGKPVAIRADRLPGTRWVSLLAADREGLVSLPIGRDLGPDKSPTRTHLLAVGIDKYTDYHLPDLGLAAADATNLKAALEALDGKSLALDSDTTVVLTDEAAGKAAILDAARAIVADTQPGDNAVISISAHGLRGEDGRFYVGLSKTSIDDIEGTALAWDDLASILATAKGRVTVLIDACHSGAAGTGLLAANDDAVNAVRSAIPSGLTVLAAAKGRELSAEMSSVGGGVFTTAITLAIGKERDAADTNHNGRIEVSELYRAVKDRVSALRGGHQTPWLARNQMIGDFALF